MLEVHPARHAATTWREFFVHIATICIGLLIAISLEQAIEAVHHRNERSDLRESMRSESQRILNDAKGSEAGANYQMAWLTARMAQVRAATWYHQPLSAPPPYSLPHFDYPGDPLWRSAISSGLAQRLTQPEVNAYSEIDLLSTKVDTFYTGWQSAESKRIQFDRYFPRNPDGSADFSKASIEDMRTYFDLLSGEFEAVRMFQIWNRDLIGAAQTILSGNLQLQAIYDAERKSAFPDGYDPANSRR
jgi:hypothetical protein